MHLRDRRSVVVRRDCRFRPLLQLTRVLTHQRGRIAGAATESGAAHRQRRPHQVDTGDDLWNRVERLRVEVARGQCEYSGQVLSGRLVRLHQ